MPTWAVSPCRPPYLCRSLLLSSSLKAHCHCLSKWLNCHTGLASGIASIAKKWLVIYTFLLLTPLCLISLHSVCLTLGQRRSHPYLFAPYITPIIITFDRLLLSRLIGAPAIVSYSTALAIVSSSLLSSYPH